MIQYTGRESEERIDLSNPHRVTAGKIIVHRDDMDPFPRECIQICWKRRDESLAFTGAHFGNIAIMEHHASNELDVEVALTERATRRFTDDSECLWRKRVEFDTLRQPFFEFSSFLLECLVRECLYGRFKSIGFWHDRFRPLKSGDVLIPCQLLKP